MLWKTPGICEDMPYGGLTVLADLYFNLLGKDYVTDQQHCKRKPITKIIQITYIVLSCSLGPPLSPLLHSPNPSGLHFWSEAVPILAPATMPQPGQQFCVTCVEL